jgi:hypothetical protein
LRIDLYFENLRFFWPIDLAQTILLNSFGPGKKIIQIRWILIFGMIGKFCKQKFEVLVRVQVVGLGGLNEYFPLMIDATRGAVAMLFRKRSFGRGAFMISPVLSFEA